MPQEIKFRQPLMAESWLIGDPRPYAPALIDQIFVGKVPVYTVVPTPEELLHEYQTNQRLEQFRRENGDFRDGPYHFVIITDDFRSTPEESLEVARQLQQMSTIPVPIAFATDRIYSLEEQQARADSVCLWIHRGPGSYILDEIATNPRLQSILRTRFELTNYQGRQRY